MNKKIIKEQFNKQVQQFSNYDLTKNEIFLKFFYDFCKINRSLHLLDFACGTGEFAIFCSKSGNRVIGIDIAEKMIEFAKNISSSTEQANIDFFCDDVENVNQPDNTFDVVTCRSAMHHMSSYKNVFKEMIRCSKPGGKICIQDMISHENKHVDQYFEKFEQLVDISHNKTLSKQSMVELFLDNDIKVLDQVEGQLEHDLYEYIGHAIQTEENLHQIKNLIDEGMSDNIISQYFLYKNEKLYFKRMGIIIYGEK